MLRRLDGASVFVRFGIAQGAAVLAMQGAR
jgi:hypothetical protein